MASVYVITRVSPRTGKRSHLVRYRLGGRETPAIHAGTFAKKELAKERAKVIEAFLAKGEVPRLEIIEAAGSGRRTMLTAAEDYLKAREIDASPGTLKIYKQAKNKLGTLGDLMPMQVTTADVQAWVLHLSETLAPASVKKYVDFARLVLDEEDRDPNPARSRKLRLPVEDSEEINPPPYEHWFAIRDAMAPRFRLHAMLMENTGLRIGELFGITWGSVDIRNGRLRVDRTATKGQRGRRRSRFVYPAPELMEWIDDLLPLEDRRPDTPVLEGNEAAFRRALTNACKFAQVTHYYPHHLRHRFISLRFQAGWSAPEVAKAAGHAKTSETLDTYAHVLTDEPIEVLQEAAADKERWLRGASVVPSALVDHEQIPGYAG